MPEPEPIEGLTFTSLHRDMTMGYYTTTDLIISNETPEDSPNDGSEVPSFEERIRFGVEIMGVPIRIPRFEKRTQKKITEILSRLGHTATEGSES